MLTDHPAPVAAISDSRAYQTVEKALQGFARALLDHRDNPTAAVDVAELLLRKACADFSPDRLGPLMSGDGHRLPAVLHEIVAERRAQISAGYDAAHDDGHTLGELAIAAGLFALSGRFGVQVVQENGPMLDAAMEILRSASDVGDQDTRKGLITAAALAIAEVERLDRISGGRPRC